MLTVFINSDSAGDEEEVFSWRTQQEQLGAPENLLLCHPNSSPLNQPRSWVQYWLYSRMEPEPNLLQDVLDTECRDMYGPEEKHWRTFFKNPFKCSQQLQSKRAGQCWESTPQPSEPFRVLNTEPPDGCWILVEPWLHTRYTTRWNPRWIYSQGFWRRMWKMEKGLKMLKCVKNIVHFHTVGHAGLGN